MYCKKSTLFEPKFDSVPSQGGTWSSATPQFMSLPPLQAIRRRARITKRLPYGPTRVTPDRACGWNPDTRWPEYLPWQKPTFWIEAEQNAQSNSRLGKFYWKSAFRSLDWCGCQATKKACECRNPYVDQCMAPCPVPECPVQPLVRHDQLTEEEINSARHFEPLECDLNCSDCQGDECGSEISTDQFVVNNQSDPDADKCTEEKEQWWQPVSSILAQCADASSCEPEKPKRRLAGAFRANQTLRATPSGIVKPISENIVGPVRATNSHANNLAVARGNKFRVQEKSYFANYGVPGQFQNTLITRARGAPDGTRSIGQPICSNVGQQPSACCSF